MKSFIPIICALFLIFPVQAAEYNAGDACPSEFAYGGTHQKVTTDGRMVELICVDPGDGSKEFKVLRETTANSENTVLKLPNIADASCTSDTTGLVVYSLDRCSDGRNIYSNILFCNGGSWECAGVLDYDP